jgi:hypothetical protein
MVDVSVSRYSIEMDGGVEWLVTFLLNRGDEKQLDINTNLMIGTSAQAEIVELRKGSLLGGSYKLSFLGTTSPMIKYDLSAFDLKSTINSLNNLLDVSVSRSSLNNGYRYFVTFNSPLSDVDLLKADDTLLTGSLASVKVTEFVRGVGILNGYFNLTFNDKMTGYLSTSMSDSSLKLELEKLSSVGDIIVSSHHNLNAQDRIYNWLVTFTTLGTPVNSGLQNLLVPSQTTELGVRMNISVARVHPGCCSVYISYNDGYDLSTSLGDIIIDDVPTITNISPSTGIVSGGLNVTISGSGFLSSNELAT